ncbi:S4 domain-containing protein YaaA [Alkalicoccus saliphilus]|jgi:ribosome-associated protein|uniref:S4 domain-containing protein YaaA n=1 Tax=Alkalicoccus saliphilus TaxID=200989 RepID=A0A2T4U2S6_9BACI|nr:S4 domain-containing protein YaaA [Alkalicoccus saliphilus]PTL37707.1 S4 domain-containing protein YaaA [Alkalicoccus saliphilus]
MEHRITVRGEYITLGQALKEAAIIPSGGAAKPFLQEFPVEVNGTADNRRGRKLYPGDHVVIEEVGELRIEAE